MADLYNVGTGGKTYPVSFSTLNYALVPFMLISGYSGTYLKKTISGFTTATDTAGQSTMGGIIVCGYLIMACGYVIVEQLVRYLHIL